MGGGSWNGYLHRMKLPIAGSGLKIWRPVSPAKEATMKALGTGVRGVGWKDIEVVRHPSGAPSIKLHGRCKARAERLGVQEIAISLSHSREFAVASVVVRCLGQS